jgi:hypothetical protein
MNWADLDALPVDSVTPPGYRYEQLSREDIAVTAEGVRIWYPDISVGSGRGFHEPSFYESHAYLANEEEKDLIVYVCKKAGEIVSVMSLERYPQSAIIHSRLAAVSPAHRKSSLASFGPFIIDEQARAMGIAMAYNNVSLKNPYAQRLVEGAGFTLIGIMPASDREMVAPGVVKHVPEALYAKIYAPLDDLLVPTDECMTPDVRDMWHRLFG